MIIVSTFCLRPDFMNVFTYLLGTQLAGSVLYSHMRHFGEIDFCEDMNWQTILQVFMKNLYLKN